METISSSYNELILVDDDYFVSLLNDINLAKDNIKMETYIFAYDEIGIKVAEALLDAARRGVTIRLLVDGIGTRNWKTLQKRVNHKRIQIKPYHPLFWSILEWPIKMDNLKNIVHYITHVNARNHRKMCIIDNKLAYIGSANIIESVYTSVVPSRWHDITARVSGLSLDELVFAFDKAWRCVAFKKQFHPFLAVPQRDPVFRLNDSWRKKKFLYKSLLHKIDNCQIRLFITSAYFVPRRFLLLKLIKAAKKGIKVFIIVPENSDVIGMSLLMSSFYYILLKSGVTIFHHQPGILHTKFLIIDDWFCLGSSNFNYRSLSYDLEVDIKIQTQIAKEKLEAQFYNYISHSSIITLDHINQQTYFQKILVKCLWMIRLVF